MGAKDGYESNCRRTVSSVRNVMDFGCIQLVWWWCGRESESGMHVADEALGTSIPVIL